MRSRVYVLNNELSGEAALRLADRLTAIPVSELDTVVLSLRDIDSIDASGVAVLVRMYSRLIRAGKALVLIDIPKRIEQTLRSVGLASVFGGRSALRSGTQLPAYAWARLPSPPSSPAESHDREKTYDPSVEDLVEAIARLDNASAARLLRTVVSRLNLSFSGIGLISPIAQTKSAPNAESDRTPAAPMWSEQPMERAGEAGSAQAIGQIRIVPDKPKAEVLPRPDHAPVRAHGLPGGSTLQIGWAWTAFLNMTNEVYAAPEVDGEGKPPEEIEDLLTDYLAEPYEDHTYTREYGDRSHRSLSDTAP